MRKDGGRFRVELVIDGQPPIATVATNASPLIARGPVAPTREEVRACHRKNAVLETRRAGAASTEARPNTPNQEA